MNDDLEHGHEVRGALLVGMAAGIVAGVPSAAAAVLTFRWTHSLWALLGAEQVVYWSIWVRLTSWWRAEQWRSVRP